MMSDLQRKWQRRLYAYTNRELKDISLSKILKEGLKMLGAMCGLWGVCGAVTSIGAALSIIDGTGPLCAWMM